MTRDKAPLTGPVVRFFGHGGGVAWYLIMAGLLTVAGSTALFAHTAGQRFQRDVARIIYNDNQELLESVEWSVEATDEALRLARESGPETPRDQPYLVVSVEERKLWYKKADEVLFETQVATGSGKSLVKEGGGTWKFETPRGRLSVLSKEEDPVWVPPDWHFVEQARKRGLALARFNRGESVPTSDGGTITVEGSDVVKRYPDGRRTVLEAADGREIVSDGRLIIPPLGTNQRRYEGVLGGHRLNLGNGYALHGTNQPKSIGSAVSHGCVRLRNEDIAKLYDMVPLGTPVYIY